MSPSTLDINKVRVILTNSRLFPYGFRQPGCMSWSVAECPNDHKCMDYVEWNKAVDRAQGFAHTYHPKPHRRITRRGAQHAPHRASTNAPATFAVDGMPVPNIDLTHDKETRNFQ